MIQTPSKVDENNFHLLIDKWTFCGKQYQQPKRSRFKYSRTHNIPQKEFLYY